MKKGNLKVAMRNLLFATIQTAAALNGLINFITTCSVGLSPFCFDHLKRASDAPLTCEIQIIVSYSHKPTLTPILMGTSSLRAMQNFPGRQLRKCKLNKM